MLTPCIEHGQRDTYGRTYHLGVRVGTHVKALIMASGEWPNGRVAMHACDNGRCINPEHLSWGTYADNANDMIAKGRFDPSVNLQRKAGEAHGCAKLTSGQVDTLRALHAEGFSRKELRIRFGVSKSQVQRILTGYNWRGDE